MKKIIHHILRPTEKTQKQLPCHEGGVAVISWRNVIIVIRRFSFKRHYVVHRNFLEHEVVAASCLWRNTGQIVSGRWKLCFVVTALVCRLVVQRDVEILLCDNLRWKNFCFRLMFVFCCRKGSRRLLVTVGFCVFFVEIKTWS